MNTGPINCSLHAGRVGEQVAVDAAGEDGGGVVLDHVAPLVVPQVAAGKDAKFVVLALGRCREHWLEGEHSRRFADESAARHEGWKGCRRPRALA